MVTTNDPIINALLDVVLTDPQERRLLCCGGVAIIDTADGVETLETILAGMRDKLAKCEKVLTLSRVIVLAKAKIVES